MLESKLPKHKYSSILLQEHDLEDKDTNLKLLLFLKYN